MDLIGVRLTMVLVTMLLSVVVPVVIIALGVWIGLRLAHRNQPQIAAQAPLDVLKLRYAKGEITQTEYEEMKKNLERP